MMSSLIRLDLANDINILRVHRTNCRIKERRIVGYYIKRLDTEIFFVVIKVFGGNSEGRVDGEMHGRSRLESDFSNRPSTLFL